MRIHADGRYVVFTSQASNLTTSNDTNGRDVFLRDLQTITTTRISTNAAGTDGGDKNSDGGIIDKGGRFVAFMSQQTGLVNNDTNGIGDDVFRYDTATQAKTLVSVNLAGTSGLIGGSSSPNISADGRFVGFSSLANDLVNRADEPGGFPTDVFLRDMTAGQTYVASVNHSKTRTGNGFSFQPRLTSDGRRLAFLSRASDLITNDLNAFAEDVFVFTLVNDGSPVLLTEENSERAIALESVTLQRDPFALLSAIKFGVDQRTRISLFVWGLQLDPGESLTAITVRGEDTNGSAHTLAVESVGDQAGVTGAKQVVVKLPDQVVGTDLWITVSLHGSTSNRALVELKP